MSTEIMSRYTRWCETTLADPDLTEELKNMSGDEERITDAFYRELEFGTGGLRGVIGAGTNRMNVHTVSKASQGLADYVCSCFPEEKRSIAVSYDSRIKSDLFAKTAAAVFAANGIRVYIYPQLMPTPCLSYAVRALKCAAGIMVTASHNPSKYNGYKVYGADGCQITTEAADAILSCIEKTDVFGDVKSGDYEAFFKAGMIAYVPEGVYDDFIAEVKKQSVLSKDEKIDRNVAIVYSPLNGTGYKPVTRALTESGYTNITLVEEQRLPDGNFPTCPYPNPEIREAMELGMRYAAEKQADLLMATDPDCDRVGIAVRDKNGDFMLLTGNEVGCLLLDYICSMRLKNGTMPKDPVLAKTIVSIDLADRIAAHYGVRTVNLLTGFKYIGEQIGLLEEEGKEESYIFGFEESYGYLTGSYVRDKDAVDGAFMIAEMFAYYRTQGTSLPEKLDELCATYGYYKNTLYSFTFEGITGVSRMQELMASFRTGVSSFGGRAVTELKDYAAGIDGLPASNVLKFYLEGNASVVVRPSGTEPKLKLYVSVCGEDAADADRQEKELADAFKQYLKED